MHSQRGWLAASVLALACVDLRPPSAAEPAEPAAASGTGEPAASVDADRFGAGWLERDGVFESYHEGIRFRRRSGWELLVDDRLLNKYSLAGSGLYHRDDEIAIYFAVNRHVGQHAIRREAALDFFQTTVPEPPMTATFAGSEVVFDAASGPEHESLHAVVLLDDGVLEIVVTHPHTDDRERIRERIRSVLADVELLTPSEIEAIRAELARKPDPQNRIGPTWSLRRGVYRDFELDLSWTSPGRDWIIITGELAIAHGASMVFFNRMEGLMAKLTFYDDAAVAETDSATWHQTNVSNIGGDFQRVGQLRRLKIGPAEALIETLAMEVAGGRTHQVIATIKHGSLGLRWMTSGPVAQVEANAALIDTMIRNTRLEAGLVETTVDGSRFVDHRLGYSLEIPPDYHTGPGIFTVDESIETATWISADGPSAFTVMVSWAGSGWTQNEIEVSLEDYFASGWGPHSSASTAALYGEWGRHLRWDPDRTEMVLVIRDHTIYMLHGTGVDPELFERVRESFAFVD